MAAKKPAKKPTKAYPKAKRADKGKPRCRSGEPTKKPTRKPKATVDPSKPHTNTRWEGFTQSVFGGMSQSDAYREHYPSSRNWKDKSVHEKSCRLMGKVRSRIEWLQSQVATKAVWSKQKLALMYCDMLETDIADFVEVDQDGELFVKVTKDSLAVKALKKAKFKHITDEHGNTVLGIHFSELELESRVTIGVAYAKLMGYDQADKTAEDHVNNEKKWLDAIMAQAEGRPRTPQSG